MHLLFDQCGWSHCGNILRADVFDSAAGGWRFCWCLPSGQDDQPDETGGLQPCCELQAGLKPEPAVVGLKGKRSGNCVALMGFFYNGKNILSVGRMSSSFCTKLCWVSLECWSRKHPLITMVPSWCGLDAALLRALSPSFSRKKNILSFLLQKQQSCFYTGWRRQQFGSEPVPSLPCVPSGTKWGRFEPKVYSKATKSFFLSWLKKMCFFMKKVEVELKTLKRF